MIELTSTDGAKFSIRPSAIVIIREGSHAGSAATTIVCESGRNMMVKESRTQVLVLMEQHDGKR